MIIDRNSLSAWIIALLGIILFLDIVQGKQELPHQTIQWDVQEYYMYLPAIIIHHDGGFDFAVKNPKEYRAHFWTNPTDNGGQMGRMTLGMAIIYLPFFLIAHAFAAFMQLPMDGFSQPYQVAISFTGFVWLLIGLIFLRKLLLGYFSEKITTLTLLIVAVGTNLWYYSTSEGAMTHATLFGLISVFFYYTVSWHHKPDFKKIIYLSLALALAILIRPTTLLVSMIFLLYGIYNRQTFHLKTRLLLQNRWQLMVGLGCMVMLAAVQIVYWKIYTGHFIYYSYLNEHFFFNRPVIGRGLFGFRKGWLIYTPVMTVALLGIAVLWKQWREFFWPILLFTLLNIYVVLSWWCWWYGGGFGLRAFIESYALLSLPLAAALNWCAASKWRLTIGGIFIIACMLLNSFQTIQYRRGILHFDAMTKKAWIYTFGRMHWPPDSLLHHVDYEQAKRGKR